MRSMMATAICLAMSLLLNPFAAAQSEPPYPTRPVRMIYGFPPGGADPPARLIAEHLSRVLGQPVVFENRPGAAGMIAGNAIAKAAPDGYTLIYVTAGHVVNYVVRESSGPFHPVRDFTPISLAAEGTQALVTRPQSPVNNIKAFLQLAKSSPGKLNIGFSGIGGISHLTAELLKYATGTNIVSVPFKGGGQVTTAAMTGDVDIAVIGAPASLPLIRAGKLKAIGVTSKGRTSMLPEVPSVAESGFPNYEANVWYGILGPAGVPSAISARLSREVAAFLSSPDGRKKISAMGIDPVGSTPERFAQYLNVEIEKWRPIVRQANIKPE